jgi:hypothetical protein
MQSRRELLKKAGALALVAGCKPSGGDTDPADTDLDSDDGRVPAPDRPAEPAPWDPSIPLDADTFPSGIRVCDVTQTGALISIHTGEDAIELVVVGEVDGAWTEAFSQAEDNDEDGYIFAEIEGLSADTAYSIVATSTDGTRASTVTRFRTALGDTGFRKLVIGATSCLGSGNPTWPSLNHAATDNADVFLLLGDTVYADGAKTVDDYRKEWQVPLTNEAFLALSRSTSFIGTWDDHEVDNNWRSYENTDPLKETVTLDQLAAATQVYREHLPWREGPGGSGLWRKMSWGSVVDIFVLDSRGERANPDTIVSQEQLDWAVEGIKSSTATFKLVLASVHMTDHTDLMATIEAEDRWQGYPEARGAIVEALEAVPGTLVITGDMHYGALQRLGRVGEPGNGIYEVAAGPSGSFLFEIETVFDLTGASDVQYPLIFSDWNYVRLELDPGMGTINVVYIADDGTIMDERLLRLA